MGKTQVTHPANQRDISHVLRDERGRWRDTPGTHDDVVIGGENTPLLPPVVTKQIDWAKHGDKHGLEHMASLVSRLRDQYAQIEPGVTKKMQSIARVVGADLEGLEYRLKTEDSMVSKLWKGMMRHGSDADTSVGYLTDTLRYTMVIPSERYVVGVQKAFSHLEQVDYAVYPSRTFKYDNESYKGLNAVFRHENGHFVEIQFHTPATHMAKEESHKLYIIAREMRRSDPQKWPLVERMRQSWSNVRLPEGFEDLPGRWA